MVGLDVIRGVNSISFTPRGEAQKLIRLQISQCIGVLTGRCQNTLVDLLWLDKFLV